MDEDLTEVVALLRRISDGDDCDTETARRLESTILRHVPDADDDERFEHLMLVLALFEPEGGEYLCDAGDLREECRGVLAYNQQKDDTK